MSKAIISQFYEAFKQQNAEKMKGLYHEKVVFNDPAFKNLNYQEVTNMWSMLLERSNGELEIEYHSVTEDQNKAECNWEAKYKFSATKRPVHNIIHAKMEFENGKIIRHDDAFNFWRWSSMALGVPGKLLGWSPMLKNKVQKMARQSLTKYMNAD